MPPVKLPPGTRKAFSSASAWIPSAPSMLITEVTLSDSLRRRRPIFVNTAPSLAAKYTAKIGIRSGIFAADITGLPMFSVRIEITARSPCEDEGLRLFTVIEFSSPAATRKNAALLQSPSTLIQPGDVKGKAGSTRYSFNSTPKSASASRVIFT